VGSSYFFWPHYHQTSAALLPHCCCYRVEKVVLPDGTEQLTGCGENCLNRLSFIHCDPRTCPCGQLCSNKPFHLLKAPQLDVFLTENRGHGVRMTQPLRRGNFVVEYAGEVSSEENDLFVAFVLVPGIFACCLLPGISM
jgi:hypothetical protein